MEETVSDELRKELPHLPSNHIFQWSPSPTALAYEVEMVRLILFDIENQDWRTKTIWTKKGHLGNSLRFNEDGTAKEKLKVGQSYALLCYDTYGNAVSQIEFIVE